MALAIGAISSSVLPPPSAFAQTQEYKVIDLGPLGGAIPGEEADFTFGLNVDGVAAYHYLSGSTRHGAFWAPDNRYGTDTCGLRRDLNALSGISDTMRTVAADVSDGGMVVGQLGSFAGGAGHRWQLASTTPLVNSSLGVLLGGLRSMAFSINDHASAAVIVGECQLNEPCAATSVPVRYVLPSGPMEALGGGPHLLSLAFDVNNESAARSVGQLVLFGGSCFISSGNPCQSPIDAAQWTGATLDTALSPLDPIMEYKARGVNDVGLSVGWGFNPDSGSAPPCKRRALRWNSSGTRFDDLWTIGSIADHHTKAEAIANEVGGILRVVGQDVQASHALLWERVNSQWQVFDLNGLICRACSDNWILIEAHDVNDAGWIVGWGTKDNQPHGYLLIPTINCKAFTCAGDVDGSGFVDVLDLLEVLSYWGCCVPGTTCPGDQDCNGTINVADLNIVIAHWEEYCGGEGMMGGESEGSGPPSIAELILLLLEMGNVDEAALLQEIMWGS